MSRLLQPISAGVILGGSSLSSDDHCFAKYKVW